MFCKRCGATLREEDRFCSQCGARVEKDRSPVNLNLMRQPEEDREHTEPENMAGKEQEAPRVDFYERLSQEPQQIYYDETLYRDEASHQKDKGTYRDTFLDKREEKSHALLTTVAILMIIAVLTAAGMILFFFMKKDRAGTDGQGSGSDIIIISDQETQGGENAQDQQAQQDQNGDVVILEDGAAEPSVPAGTDNPEGGAEPAPEPAAETEAEAAAATPETEAVPQGKLDPARLEEILRTDSTAAVSAVYIYDLAKNCHYEAGSYEEPMYASALISVPILYTAAVKLDRQEITLNDAITYVNSIGGRGEAYPEEKDGKSFPLSYYLTTMLAYSDNNCMNCLIDYLGLETINATCQSAGFSSVDLQRKIVSEVTDGKDNYISARDLAGMVKELYGGKYNTISREFMKTYFRIDAGDAYPTAVGLAPELPGDCLFLNQNGRGDTRYNEAAVIAGEDYRYVIAVMFRGDYGFQYETAVKNISSYVYQSLK